MIVIEASAMVDALVDDPASPELLALLAGEELHVPALLDFEVASALRGHALGGLLDAAKIEKVLDDFAALRIERHQMTHLLRHMLSLRQNFTAHDAAYVVLALGLNAPLITSDAKLKEAERHGAAKRNEALTGKAPGHGRRAREAAAWSASSCAHGGTRSVHFAPLVCCFPEVIGW